MIGIYKITNPENKVYIGQSCNIENRWNQHKNSKKLPKLWDSFQRYGYQNHKFEIIEECLLEELNKKEIYHKQKFIIDNSWEFALFCELYDIGGGGPRSEEVKQKISNSNKGKHPKNYNIRKGIKLSKEIKLKMSLSHKDKPLSKEHKESISKAMKGHIKSKEWRYKLSNSLSNSIGIPIDQFDLNENFIRTWKTGKLASNELKINYGAINACCIKNRNRKEKFATSAKYIWKYSQTKNTI